MSSSLWIKVIFILALAFNFETVVAHPGNTIPQQPYCEPYRNVTDCLDTLNPICGDDGKSYDNQCYFCTETFRKNLSYKHLGICT
eukprot:XP_017452257.1 PREDICTED: serine protease inhibitor Kazal-type 11-like isoform X2 [Rattus norvegicus]